MEKAQLVCIPLPLMGHIVSAVEVAKLLLTRDHRLSITVLILNLSFVNSNQKPHVKEAVLKITQSKLIADSPAPRLAGFVIDMFCTTMIDVANDFGVPSFIFFTSGAAVLGLLLYVQKIHDEEKVDPIEFKNSDAELSVPSLVKPFPAKAMPSSLLSRQWLPVLLDNARRFGEARGIIVNTFVELESYAVESLKMSIYPVGPILNVGLDGRNTHQEIMQWLDDQPPSSVVFLCFGSQGSFGEDQVKEIAYALECSRYRFLWSLRRPSPPGLLPSPSDYEDPQEVLPEGFLNRMTGIGKVIGWAPQVTILAHPAVGGFVSHCGWNSVLESIWFGVPIATWPMYAEQQFNAFEMVTELELAVEIKMDYRNDSGVIVNCNEIERGIRSLMEHDSKKMKKVKEMSENSRRALMDSGSSYCCLGRLIKNFMDDLT
ncbi:anthocyanidin 3-O-glucosyltransferase 2-like isoform X3 [Hevea brasiliensis]|uniref:anthocyanidin 3-O-glucosyltransferase 2-like isoform X3 n=1 Tax=Hevea brasiliensis TaxID=3981 RepID=UPI0025E7D0BD|nr:anthocyanidin 3-O-glucosyltransferase 2-like isoform X3 [Hevea brasiliensis]